MPYRKRFKPRRQPVKRRSRIYGTKARFMPKTLALKRYGQVSTKTFYFKTAGTINSLPNGVTTFGWNTQSPGANPGDPNRMPNVSDSFTFAECYNEYKVLSIKVRVFAANVGAEGGTLPGNPTQGGIPIAAGFNRGNTVMYLDQEIRPNEQVPTNIVDVMTLGSCKMIPSRVSQYTKILYRKKGVPEWGCCDRNVAVADRAPDPWHAGIFLLGNNARLASIGITPLWFYTVTYKIIFRGRSFTP